MERVGPWVLLGAFFVLVLVAATAPWAVYLMWWWPATYLIIAGTAVATYFILDGIRKNREVDLRPEG